MHIKANHRTRNKQTRKTRRTPRVGDSLHPGQRKVHLALVLLCDERKPRAALTFLMCSKKGVTPDTSRSGHSVEVSMRCWIEVSRNCGDPRDMQAPAGLSVKQLQAAVDRTDQRTHALIVYRGRGTLRKSDEPQSTVHRIHSTILVLKETLRKRHRTPQCLSVPNRKQRRKRKRVDYTNLPQLQVWEGE